MIQWLNSTTMRFLSLLEWFAVTHNSQKVSAEFSVIVLKGRWNNLKAELQNDGDCNMLLTCCGATYFSVIRAPQTSLCFSVLHWYRTAPCSSTDTELVFAGLLSSYPDKMCWLKKYIKHYPFLWYWLKESSKCISPSGLRQTYFWFASLARELLGYKHIWA